MFEVAFLCGNWYIDISSRYHQLLSLEDGFNKPIEMYLVLAGLHGSVPI